MPPKYYLNQNGYTNGQIFFQRCCDGLLQLLQQQQYDQDSRVELLKAIFKFSSVYNSDFKKCEQAFLLLQGFLSFTESILPSASPTEFLFLVQIWVQLRDSEHPFFVSHLTHLHSLLLAFLDLDDTTLTAFYYDDENTSDQITSPLGKLYRLFSSCFTRDTFLPRLQNPASLLRLTWIIEIYANYLSNRISYQAESQDDQADGQICSIIFSLLSRPLESTIYEKALLTFLEEFKHVYLTGDGSSCPKLWEILGSQDDIMGIYMTRIFTHLTNTNQPLVAKSIQVFKELVNGTRTGKLLQGDNVREGIENSGLLSMDMVMTYQESKCLIILFENLGRVFMSESCDQDIGMVKLCVGVQEYFSQYRNGNNDGRLIDLCVRKLRGVLASIYSCKLFKKFFEWVDGYIDVLGYYLDTSAPNGPVNVLKFMRDFGTNKVNRMLFESNAEYGILVFRRVMKIVLPIVIKLEGALSGELPENIWVDQCLKPIVVIMDTFKNLISSRAVPFGIMELYGDSALKEMVQAVFLLSSFIRPEQLLGFPKLGAAYFNMWVCMAGDYISYLCKAMDDKSFETLAMNTYAVLENFDNSTSSQA